MALDALRQALPGYAADLRRNLAAVVDDGRLPEPQLWGALLACAVAVRSAPVLRAVAPEARARLTPEAYDAARTAAATMATNNVFFRARHLLSDPGYGHLRAGLRTNVLGPRGVPKADYELWCVAVSAVGGCGACLDEHERALRRTGAGRETVQEALKVAAVVHAVGTVLDAEAALDGTG
ncbi:carboxymuconolactone decarboxylase family protein [Streptomyces sp. MAR4 CNX-425]|uniref:carboxymuconolactone decarboxylase family protein n=1 Tax=Streptomyces sp. MAR4 CNX-425 TaxID=3406343 RepID=UPI003B501453